MSDDFYEDATVTGPRNALDLINDKAEELGFGRPFCVGMHILSYHSLLGQMTVEAINRINPSMSQHPSAEIRSAQPASAPAEPAPQR